jgi:hypothetical protein
VDNSDKRQAFTKYPKILKHDHALHFLRHAAHVGFGRAPADGDRYHDGGRSRNAPQRESRADSRSQYHGRFASGPGHRGGSAGRSAHDGRARGAEGTNRRERLLRYGSARSSGFCCATESSAHGRPP